jgi:transketolase
MKLGNIKEKFLAFNWEVLEMDGNNMEEVVSTLQKAKTFTGKGKPIVIIMKTVMGKGVHFMKNNHEWHGSAPNADQYKKATDELPETIGDY